MDLEAPRPGDRFPDVGYVRRLKSLLTGEPLADVIPLRRRLSDIPYPVVGLIGKKRSGKDTFAQGLVERGVTRVAFADPLKEAALALDPFVRTFVTWDEYLDPEAGAERLSSVVARLGWEAAKEIPEVRRTLQNYGVAIREIDPAFWVRAGMLKAAAIDGPVVITDVRFPNEAKAVVDVGGIVVRVVRPGLVSTDEHVSETALDDYPADLTVTNSGTAEDLIDLARTMRF